MQNVQLDMVHLLQWLKGLDMEEHVLMLVCYIDTDYYMSSCSTGCVPKKVMYNAAHVAETIHEANNFGYALCIL